MDKSELKILLIDWLNDINDMTKTMRFVYFWVKNKMPEIDENRLREFTNKLYQSTLMPSFFNENPATVAIRQLLEIARIELEVNAIIKTENYNQIIKYY